MADSEAQIAVGKSAAGRATLMLETSLEEIGIPMCPAIITQIKAEMEKEDPDLHTLDRTIRSDVGIAAGLIGIANSPYFGSGRSVRSVKEALQVLGLATAGRAVAGIALRNIFPITPQIERFWNASATVARLSGWLAQQIRSSKDVRAEDAYTYGLFRDCGIPVLMKRYGLDYEKVLKLAEEDKAIGFTKVEESKFPTNHASVGSALSRAWRLPEEITLAIRHHHDKNMLSLSSDFRSGNEAVGLIAVGQIAEHLAQFHNPKLRSGFEWEAMGPVALRALGITEEALQDLYGPSKQIALASK